MKRERAKARNASGTDGITEDVFDPSAMDLSHWTIVDQHAHNVLRSEAAARLAFAAAFTEGVDPEIVGRFARDTLFYRRSLRDLGELFHCEPTEAAILACRNTLGLEKLTRLCFDSARLESLLLDDGFRPEDILPLDWHAQFVPVQRLLRLEALAQDLIPSAASFDDFLDQFRSALDPPPANVAAFKSIAAYRTGLAIERVSRGEAAAHFAALRPQLGARFRLADKPLIDFLFAQALEVAAKHRLPVQLHTGFGDPDLDLRQSSPLHLRPWLEDTRFREAPIVLLHASYPFMREAGYLASLYPQVYLDFGLAVPFLSVAGMRQAISGLLELAPFTKVMYSSDAHLIPELFSLAARWGRQALGDVLEEAVRDRDLTAGEADEAAQAILARNARTLYR